ncbi:MAG TPA: retropepsin-like aspartic protease [Candidatus Elarobacter sp.]|jgi:hypothetical protein|nr:retropepsin-like aspartic protease [Candidatus Elarobacter sp.]
MNLRVLLAAAVAACSLAIPFEAEPARADDPAAILAKHKAYVGWAYGDGTLKSVRQTIEGRRGSGSAPKPEATPDPIGPANWRSVELRRELLYRAYSNSYGLEVESEGFTGAVFWRSNANGQTVTRRGRDAQEALTSDLIDAEGFSEAQLTARPDQQFDGKSAAVIRMQPKTAVPADLFFDRDSGALLGYTLQPDVPLERFTVHVTSYAEFAPGKRYVSAYRIGDSKYLYAVTAFEPNAPVSDADLHPPAVRAAWSFGEPRSVPIAVVTHTDPYSNSGARAVHVDVSVNGHPGHFLLDSGAGSILIYDRLARAAGLKDIGRTSYGGVNGAGVEATIARADTLSIGGNVLHNVVVTHGALVNGAAASDVDGIIGFDALAGAVFNVDLVTNRLSISNPADYTVEAKQGAWAFSPDLGEFHIGTPVKIGETVLSHVWLDTGNDFFVILPHELEKKTVAVANDIVLRDGRSFQDKKYFGGVDGIAGEPANCVRLNEIQIGPYRYQKALSCFAPNDTFGLDGGLIGFDFLRHFNWTFDYPHNRVVLTPNGL